MYFEAYCHCRKRKICADCKEEADEARDDMVLRLRAGVAGSRDRSCLPETMPLPKDCVTLDDSDQERRRYQWQQKTFIFSTTKSDSAVIFSRLLEE